MLSTLCWGDRIWLAQGDMKKKTNVETPIGSVLFGSFQITRIGGVVVDALYDLERTFPMSQLWKGARVIERASGSYTIDSEYEITTSLLELGKYFNDSCDPYGKLLLQGSYDPLPQPSLLPDVFFRWGYRRFDAQTFIEAYKQQLHTWGCLGEDRTFVLIPAEGEFKATNTPTSNPRPKKTYLQIVSGYSQYEDFKNPYEKKKNL
jgi:hypothetical protein